ncbi:Cytochrome P450 monooxygenase [Podosphaera aphanis]|nr:Cytochrome P450 monooxygenase [Podosphaera aphanis]
MFPTNISFLLHVPVLAIALLTIYAVSTAVYNIFFHPLRKYPGPILNKITGIVIGYQKLKGTDYRHLKHLHEKYGDVVRTGPYELSFINEQAWLDIYGHHSHSGRGNLPKDTRLQRRDVNGSLNIITADEVTHRRMRRIQTNMFSERALLSQEPLINTYINMLITNLRKRAASSHNIVDIVKWYNYTTFDVLGDLAFGEPFGCLESNTLHEWIDKTFLSVKEIGLYTASRDFPWPLNDMVYIFSPGKSRTLRTQQSDFCGQKARERMSRNSIDRADFMSYILKHNDEKGMTAAEIENNARILIIAGSETTATFLSGLTYNLLLNPEHLRKLTALIRTTFKSEEDIKIKPLTELEYLTAVINESFRIYPPVPIGLTRRTNPGGSVICDDVIPEMTRVSVAPIAANQNPKNWTNPDKFVPERWYKDEKCPEIYRTDKRKVMQPFSFGPRNCIGKNLAMAEMRLIIARVLWNFNLQLDSHNSNWFDQKVYLLWEKKPLMVKLTLREVQI